MDFSAAIFERFPFFQSLPLAQSLLLYLLKSHKLGKIPIWVGFPRTGTWLLHVTLKKECWIAVAKPDLLRHFFQWFCGEHDFLITLPQPQTHINYLQYTAMHSKCTKNALSKVTQNSAVLVYFECIAVHCSELMESWGWGSVMRKSCSTHNNRKKGRRKSGLVTTQIQQFFLKLTRNSQISRPGETYPHVIYMVAHYRPDVTPHWPHRGRSLAVFRETSCLTAATRVCVPIWIQTATKCYIADVSVLQSDVW